MSAALAVPLLAGQLAVLEAEFRGWDVAVESFGTDYWFEARRRACSATSCRCCSIVAGSAARMRELIIAASALGPEVPT